MATYQSIPNAVRYNTDTTFQTVVDGKYLLPTFYSYNFIYKQDSNTEKNVKVFFPEISTMNITQVVVNGSKQSYLI